MSDGITRVCDVHKMELRQIGAGFVCPAGHQCDLEWHIPATGLPWADPILRLCPIHGKRLTGAGDILSCDQYAHQCSTRESDRPAAKTPTAVPAFAVGRAVAPKELSVPTKPQRLKTEEPSMPVQQKLHPHGTAGRYWQKCRCQPCRDAIREYQRQKREGAAKPRAEVAQERALPALRRKAKAPNRRTVRRVTAELVPGRNAITLSGGLARAVSEIAGLREQLAEAESRFRAEVASFLQGWSLVPSHTVVAHALAARRPK